MAPLIGAGEQGASRLGQADLTPDAIEQPQPQLRLQGGDALAYRRLGQVQPLARIGEAAGFGHRDEGIQIGEVQDVEFLLVMRFMKKMNLFHASLARYL